MNGCIYRTRSDLCMKFTTDKSISFCVGKKCPDRKESNADRIRSMTDEELANLFGVWVADCDNNDVPCKEYCSYYKSCGDAWLAWLKEEVRE